MPRFTVPRLLTGVEVLDGWIETVCAAIERANNLSASPPVMLQTNPEGMHFTARRYPGEIRHAKTTSTITARATATLGTGNADLYNNKAGVLTIEAPTNNVDVVNWTGVSIATTTWVLIAVIDGEWTVVSADCP
jgi:hypothetical protein